MRFHSSLGFGLLPLLSFSIVLCGKSVFSAPVAGEDFSITRRLDGDRITDYKLDLANQVFPGIDWDFAADDVCPF